MFSLTSRQTVTLPLAIVALGMAGTVGAALLFEHVGGFVPCALCLEQRNPYYWGIPFVLAGLLGALLSAPACMPRGALAIGGLCLLATAALGMYHSGVEWGWFEPPATCGAGLTGAASDAGSLLESLSASRPPSCDEAAGRFLGISFANANVIASLALAVVAWRGLRVS